MSHHNTELWELSLIKCLSATLAQKYPKAWEENQHWLRDIIENRQNLLAKGYDYWKVVLITFWYLLPFGWSVVCRIAKREARKISRNYLLKVLVEFENNTQSLWVRRITYWVIRNFESKQVVRPVLEEIVDFDLLPDDVRQEWLKRGKTTQNMDVTQVRDRARIHDDELENKSLFKGKQS